MLRRLIVISVGSLLFVVLKFGLVALVHTLFAIPAWLNYLAVTISISLLGWIYHSKVSFRLPLNRETLRRYIGQAITLKIAEVCVYNVAVYIMAVDLRYAVLLTGVLIFAIRVTVYTTYVFRSAGPETDKSVIPAG